MGLDSPAQPTSTKNSINPNEQSGNARNLDIASYAVLAFFTFIHLVLIFQFPLAPDETYYWEWSRHLAWGYYDQGPMIAWWIRGSCLIFGDTVLGIRFGIVVACFGIQLFTFLLAKMLFGRTNAFLSLIVSSITPLALAGAFIATYDPLVVLFWTATMYFIARSLFRECRIGWYLAGLCFGLGLLSKHTMLVLAPCLLLFLFNPKYRHWLKRPQPWLAMLIAIIIFLPNIAWQSTHEWATFRHLFLLTGKGLDHPFYHRLGDFVGSQFALLSPILFFGMLAALNWAAKQRKSEIGDRLWYAFCMGGPVLILFVAITAKSKVQANWAICGWITPPLLWVARLEWNARTKGALNDENQSVAKALSLFLKPLPLSALALCGFITTMISWPDARVFLHVGIANKFDTMNVLYGGQELGEAADCERQSMETELGKKIAIGAVTYDNASRLAFYMKGQPDAFCWFLNTRKTSYYLWQDAFRPKPGENALIVDDHAPDDPKLPELKAIFDRVVPVGKEIDVYRIPLYKDPVHTYYLYKCYGYRPDPTIEKYSGG